MLSSIFWNTVVPHDVGELLVTLVGEKLASEKAASSYLLVLRLPGGSRTRRET